MFATNSNRYYPYGNAPGPHPKGQTLDEIKQAEIDADQDTGGTLFYNGERVGIARGGNADETSPQGFPLNADMAPHE